MQQNHIKQYNMSKILAEIRVEGSVSRIALARRTGFCPATLTRMVGRLCEFGLVSTGDAIKTGAPGRSTMPVSLNPHAFYTLAVAIFNNDVYVGLLDFKRQFVGRKQAPLAYKMAGPALVFEQIRTLYDELLQECALNRHMVKCMGVCCVGAVSRAENKVIFSPVLLWTDVDLNAMCDELFGLPLVAENDVKAALIAEREARYKDIPDIAYFKLGSGMEASAFVDGHLLCGAQNAAGSLGHVTVETIDTGGLLCECGRQGCLQTLVSERLIVGKAREFAPDIKNLDEVMMAYQLGIDWADSLVKEMVKSIAIGLNQLVCHYNPRVIVVGGELVSRYSFLLPLAVSEAQPLFYKALSKDVEIVAAVGGGLEALLGAGILAQEHYLATRLEELVAQKW